jgi:branched-chain amino acid transport system ATP-binding protein
MSAPVLRIVDLFAGYEPDVPVVRGANMEIFSGEIVAILGPNGAGKSTLIRAVAGLVPVFGGRVDLGGRDITGWKSHDLIRQGLAFVPQTENVFASMSVAENLALASAVLARAQRRVRLDSMYEFFPDLARQKSLLAGRLSGGQRQMLAIARALMIEPKLLMLDEPSAGLSPKLVASVFGKLGEIRESGVAILLVEQNARAALAVGDRAYVLAEGQNRHEGPAAALGNDPVVARLYLGGMAAAHGRSANP